MKEKKKEMVNIKCPKCSKKNTFINGKCNFCNEELIVFYDKRANCLLGYAIIFAVLTICFLVALRPYLCTIFALLSAINFSDMSNEKRAGKRLLQISKNNTIFKEEQEKIKKKEIEKRKERKLQKLEKERTEIIYKECSKNNLLKIDKDENKRKLLEIAEKLGIKKDIESVIKQMHYVERKKDIIFRDYVLMKAIKEILKEEGIASLIERFNADYNLNNENVSTGKNVKNELFLLTSKPTKNKASKIIENIEYYSKIIEVIENDEELTTICQNLLKIYANDTYIDYNKISKKIYDIYNNSYKGAYKINITQKDFSNILFLMKNKNCKKEDYSDLYTLIFEDYKDVKSLPEKIYDKLMSRSRNIFFYEDMIYNYIMDQHNKHSFYEICALLLEMDKICAKYYKMIAEERKRIKDLKMIERAKKKEQNAKEEIEKERLRLLRGDFLNEDKQDNKIST